MPAQVKQGIHKRIKNSIVALSKMPPKLRGKLKYKREINSIPLIQHKITYKIMNDEYIKIVGIKQKLKTNGLNQIPEKAEIANANLVKRAGDYFLKITCFIPKENQLVPENKIALDFGIATDITFSNGIKLNIKKPVLKSIIKKQKNLSRKKKNSKNYLKTRLAVQKAYDRENNQKRDKKNKVVSFLTHNFQVVVQDENIKSWTKKFGKSIHQSAIGGIMVGLKQHPHTLIVDRWFPSTRLCNVCGKLNRIKLSERIYKCKCGNEIDRDLHSAMNILIKQFPMERRNIILVENRTSTFMFKKLNKFPNVSVSFICGNEKPYN